MRRRLRIFTWHVHGNYLWYLSLAAHDFYLPIAADRTDGYGGRGATFPFGTNVHDVPIEQVRDCEFDCLLFQSRRHFDRDQYEILTSEQRMLPRIYLEHDPPQEHPTDTLHWAQDPEMLLVHVTPFNALMWNNGVTPTRIVDHGVMVPSDVRYRGHKPRGVVVINNLSTRGRRLGVDVFEEVRRHVPLDLVGMSAEDLDGIGEIKPPDLPEFIADYRFLFNPIRYTSLGLAVIEAMTIGLPIVGLATTEMVTAIENGVSGFVETDIGKLIARMRQLLNDPPLARQLGEGARRKALARFSVQRFVNDWEQIFAEVAVNQRSVGLGPRETVNDPLVEAHATSTP
ncbi:MAG TPA: glycosyltransferase family 4 protein [Pirellulales bacterium]|nr:glycosyltransferase family 4 protein [Pirellulales bacterium]